MLDRIQIRSMLPRELQVKERVRIPEGPLLAQSQALWRGRGFLMRCAACGLGKMFKSFLQPVKGRSWPPSGGTGISRKPLMKVHSQGSKIQRRLASVGATLLRRLSLTPILTW